MNKTNETRSAIIMVIVAMLILPCVDAIAKWLSSDMSSGEITWSRFFFQILIMAPLLVRTSGPWWTSSIKYHAGRGFFIAMATLLFFSGLKYLPITDAIAIFFIEPLMVTLLSVLILGEKVGWRRFLAIGFGFIGALIIIRPAFSQIGWPVFYPVASALCFSFYILLTRKLVAQEDPIRLQFWAGCFGFLVMSGALLVGDAHQQSLLLISVPSKQQWLLMAGLGVCASLAHLFVVHAYKRAPVSVLAPFQYVEIIGSTVLGYFIFKDFPDSITWLGIAIIIVSGMYVFHKES